MDQETERIPKRRKLDRDEPQPNSEPSTLDDWAVSSNDALCLRLVRPEDMDSEIDIFHPLFTYPVFGMEETINGYQNLKIKLYYAAGSLATYVGISYDNRRESNGSQQPDDIMALLSEKLPPGFAVDYDEFMQTVQEDEKTFVPFGTKIHEFDSDGDVSYEVYKCNFKTPGFKEYHRRLQVFLLWFIEGASFLEENDERWEMVLLFERQKKDEKNIYSIVGYATYYPFFHYPDRKRMRISQFIILPPYQARGLGERLYKVLYNDFFQRSDVAEMTVEDPNEAFQDLRDKCDLSWLIEQDAFAGLQPPVPGPTVKELATRFKLSKRQLERCMEMALLRNLKLKDKKAYQAYRMQVKRRIFRQNEEALMGLEKELRLEKLDETYVAVEEDHRRILERLK
ncbi:histone acetyltransferase catalytic subunit HAT1 [Spizellomyces punctatus DAOM BR117]|uniref:Histone acetyltransferase type B catalytic subunit n=1 Tax=Spizellomyces punctatus (strain DAOM BR117) TaxID=645134 RepID=A0A0L0HP94_SPIPD|nr:histone acetyltransferase catalytic subunit HAT1 [Spizellomyces punctatus DAOM BR117]KND02790.1 hypothetical protein SPPG_01871 [Spizellomyces punctatus DAOM BR117]|eukprot:XP_016610829.1 hypothetical protein SPPG_01871 [Spizellomyces punctatus DAOM BR117]